ncbi:ABC transporter ATP-binding protein [Clostridium fungisolvens]|uniref:Iron(3+)-hydroxamate import ATP-binding protein FhuC n=1 Tax=Clostridium fungisolvens TaxID=1604897 RepID=A0A6V8SG55_9CLOT|nr:ABC transporter ATP-binding protein [Clostridium fungisolvens]GFP74128.1 Iron(3+)-hydroxamate import ATP-binding protein FhuC [Clostridium fungisolvens]
MSIIDIIQLQYDVNKVTILKDIDLTFEAGKFYSIVGPNGSGKTTLIKNIIKYLSPSEGTVIVENKDVNKIKAKEFANIISYVPQDTVLEMEFSCYDVVMMGRNNKISFLGTETNEDIKKVEEAMKATEVFQLKDKLITEISGGERQRVLLARAIAQDSRCIILDEPLSNLDIKHQLEIIDILNKLRDLGKTIIAVLHDINLALNYTDHAVMMKNGKIFYYGKTEDVINDKNIEEVYGVSCKIVSIEGVRHIIFTRI